MADESKGITKPCTKCGEVLDLEAGFHRDKRAKDGRQSQCKACVRENGREWYAANVARARANMHRWTAANPERIAKNNRRWTAANPDRKREISRRWAAANAERVNELVRQRRAADPEKQREASRQQREAHPRRNKARNAVSVALREGKLTPGFCSVCGLEPKKVNGRQRIQAHHHRGYDEDYWLDIVWLCRPCHALVHRK